MIKGLRFVAVEERPKPVIEYDTDVLVRTRISGLCGPSPRAAKEVGRRAR